MMIYISYNAEDRTSALYLTQILKHQSVDVWIDVEKLLAGDLLSEKVEEGLNTSTAIVICIGKNGLSDWQANEINAAYQIHSKNKSFRIIPILLPGSDVSLIPIILQSFSKIDFHTNFENKVEIENLLKAIKGKDFIPSNITPTSKTYKTRSTRPKNKRAVSVALLFNNEILIVQRAETQKSGGGLWQLPGGKVDESETPNQAAIREIDEEVGIHLEEDKLIPITELVDTWVINNSDDYITMGLYLAELPHKQTIVANEFSNSRWIKISEIFFDSSVIYFGSSARYLRIIRRFVSLHLPLKEISQILLSKNGNTKTLPLKLQHASLETSQTIYSFLSLLGFLNDKGNFTSSSTLSGNLIKMLSEWTLTESVIFEADSEKKWQDEVEKKGNLEEVEKFREGLFDQHENLLGLLSHRLPKALSTRNVCDILLTANSSDKSKTYLLIRWDFLATKFQIPAKGLEEVELNNITSIDSPQFVVKKRLHNKLLDKFDYKYFSKIKTSHVGAGSLDDGPILRNFTIAVFDLIPKANCNDEIIEIINQINSETIKVVEQKNKLGKSVKRALNFYVWVDIDYLETKKKTLTGKKLQGFEEIISEFGIDFLKNNRTSIVLNDKNKIPVIGKTQTQNPQQLDTIIKSY